MPNPDAEVPTQEGLRPVVLRGGTVFTMDDAHTVLADADVLVVGDRIAAVGPHLEAPATALEIDAVRRTVEATVDYLCAALGEQARAAGMNPDLPGTEVLDNPYQYTDYKSTSTHGARGSVFGESG